MYTRVHKGIHACIQWCTRVYTLALSFIVFSPSFLGNMCWSRGGLSPEYLHLCALGSYTVCSGGAYTVCSGGAYTMSAGGMATYVANG